MRKVSTWYRHDFEHSSLKPTLHWSSLIIFNQKFKVACTTIAQNRSATSHSHLFHGGIGAVNLPLLCFSLNTWGASFHVHKSPRQFEVSPPLPAEILPQKAVMPPSRTGKSRCFSVKVGEGQWRAASWSKPGTASIQWLAKANAETASSDWNGVAFFLQRRHLPFRAKSDLFLGNVQMKKGWTYHFRKHPNNLEIPTAPEPAAVVWPKRCSRSNTTMAAWNDGYTRAIVTVVENLPSNSHVSTENAQLKSWIWF